MKTKKTKQKVAVSMSGIFILSMLMVFFNAAPTFAYDDFDEGLIIRADHGDGPKDFQPRSIVIGLEDAITAVKSNQSIKIEFDQSLISGDVVIGIEKSSIMIYQTQVTPAIEGTVFVDISNLQAGGYKLWFADSNGRKAYAEFTVTE